MPNGKQTQERSSGPWVDYAPSTSGGDDSGPWQDYKPKAPTGNAGTVDHPLVTPIAGEDFAATMRRGVEMGRRVTPDQISTATRGATRDVPLVLGAASASPLIAGMLENPISTVAGIGGGALGSITGRQGARALGFDETGQAVAEFGGGVLGSFMGGVAPTTLGARLFRTAEGEVRPLFGAGRISRALDRVVPYAPGARPQPITARDEMYNDLAERRVARGNEQAALDREDAKAGAPVPLTESPNYPRIAAGRRAAMRSAEAELPSGQYTPLLQAPTRVLDRIKSAQAFEQGEPGPFNRVSESPNAPRTEAQRSFDRGEAGPFNRVSESPNRPPEQGSALGRITDPNVQPPPRSGNEGRAATWTNEFVMREAAKGSREAIEQANLRGLPLPENARYVMGDADYPRTVLNPKETTKFAPEPTPIRDVARPERSSGARLVIPKITASRETTQFGPAANTSEAERILSDPLATAAQKQAARHFLGMSP